MNVNAYLNFPGTCEEAFNFYAKCLGGKVVAMIRASDTPMKDITSADRQDKIMHARMIVGDTVLMGSDAPPSYFKPATVLDLIDFCVPIAAEVDPGVVEL